MELLGGGRTRIRNPPSHDTQTPLSVLSAVTLARARILDTLTVRPTADLGERGPPPAVCSGTGTICVEEPSQICPSCQERICSRTCHFIAPSARERASFQSERGGMTIPTSGLIEGFAQVDSEGRIALPRNTLIATDLEERDTVELKIAGTSRAKKTMISERRNHRQINNRQ